jgi:hypothetical protein
MLRLYPNNTITLIRIYTICYMYLYHLVFFIFMKQKQPFIIFLCFIYFHISYKTTQITLIEHLCDFSFVKWNIRWFFLFTSICSFMTTWWERSKTNINQWYVHFLLNWRTEGRQYLVNGPGIYKWQQVIFFVFYLFSYIIQNNTNHVNWKFVWFLLCKMKHQMIFFI